MNAHLGDFYKVKGNFPRRKYYTIFDSSCKATELNKNTDFPERMLDILPHNLQIRAIE